MPQKSDWPVNGEKAGNQDAGSDGEKDGRTGQVPEFSVEEARSIFIHDRYAMVTTGIDILEVADGYARCCFTPDSRHKNARGAVMGGALFTLADFTFAVASNYNKPYGTVTNVSQISFLRAAAEGVIYAQSRLIKDGRTSCTYEIQVTDETGKLFAVVTVNGIHVPKGTERAK